MDHDSEAAIYRIIAGHYYINIDKNQYKVILPNLSTKQKAYQLYLSVIDEYKFDTSSWISPKVINNLLKLYNLWDESKEDKLKILIDDINKLKIQLFLNFNNDSLKNTIKSQIALFNENINEAYSKKHYFDYLTLEHYAQSIKSQFLIVNTIYNLDETQVFNYDDFNSIDSVLLDKILAEIYNNSISTDTIKKIARSETWRSFWGVSKENIFEGKVKDWTDEQRSLVNFSKVLDSVREHMEAPSEEVINDDDALEGWMLHQHEKIEKEKKTKQINDRYGLDKKDGNEVFILTKDKKEQKTINELNDPQTRRDLKAAAKLINEKGTVKEVELPHIKREIKNKFNEMTKERMRAN